MAKNEMDIVKALFPFVLVFSSMSVCVLCSQESISGHNPLPTVVKGLDLKRFMGRWYEIAALPSFFELKNSTDRRATYTLNKNGTVSVLNEAFVQGKRGFVRAIAYKADPKSDEAKLKVKFFVPGPPVVGDFWVLYIDADYHYAVVGQPDRKQLWILSRKSHIGGKIYKMLVHKAAKEGYDVSKLEKVSHKDTPPQ